MFKRTDRQISLWDSAQSSESARKRLQKSWADGFSGKILPILLEAEESFAHLYDSGNGRPNWSVARMLGICLLQEMQDLDDQSALDSVTFDLRWQHALGLNEADAYLSRRSLVDFRSRLVSQDPNMELMRKLFEQIGAAAIEDLKISTQEQRIDSTLIRSNIHTRGRVDLFRKTLLYFLRWLEKSAPKKLGRLDKGTRKWYKKTQDEGWFARVDKEKRDFDKRLVALATKLQKVIAAFSDDRDLNQSEPYLIVVRLFSEHCEVKRNRDSSGVNGEIISVEKSAKDPGNSLQSPFDPDVKYGHKGAGYHVQITETCRNKEAGTEIITDYDVLAGNETDRNKDGPALERLRASRQQPKTLYADSGYPSGQGILDAAAKGTEIVAPMSAGRLPENMVGRESFEFDKITGECMRCPRGHAPTRHGLRRSPRQNFPASIHTYFDGKICRACPLKTRCAARKPNNGKPGSFHLEIGAHLIARDLNLEAQRKEAWWNRYKIRSGIEATMSELKRSHGLGLLRVRRKPRVKLAVSLKIMSCNIKRWMRVTRVKPDAQLRHIFATVTRTSHWFSWRADVCPPLAS